MSQRRRNAFSDSLLVYSHNRKLLSSGYPINFCLFLFDVLPLQSKLLTHYLGLSRRIPACEELCCEFPKLWCGGC